MKKLTALLLILALAWPSLAAAHTVSAGRPVVGWDGLTDKPAITVGDQGYPTFAAAVTTLNAAGTNHELILGPGNHASAGVTSNSNIKLTVLPGALFTGTGTLTVDGPFEAGNHKIFNFTGGGKVVWGAGSVTRLNPAWWGITGTNDEVAINAAIQSLGAGASVYGSPRPIIDCRNRTYSITNQVLVDKDFCEIDAQGAVFNHAGTANVFYFNDTDHPRFTGFKIILNSDGDTRRALALGDCRFGTFEGEVQYSNSTTPASTNHAVHMEPPDTKYCYGNRIRLTTKYVGWMARLITPDSFSNSAVHANELNIFGFLCGNGLYVKGCKANDFTFLDIEPYTGPQTFFEFRKNGNAAPVAATDNRVKIVYAETHRASTNWIGAVLNTFDAECTNNRFEVGYNAFGVFHPTLSQIPVTNPVYYLTDNRTVDEREDARNLKETVGGLAPNLLSASEDFTDAGWVKTNLTATGNSTTAPDGSSTADTLTQTAQDGYIYQQKTGLAAGDIQNVRWTGSVWLKAASNLQCELKITSDGYATGDQLAQKIFVTTTWQRFEASMIFRVGSSYTALQIRPSKGNGTDGNQAIFAWGAQLQKGPLTAYIPSNSIASSATPTPSVGIAGRDTTFYVTALAAGATFGAPTGTPVNGQNLIIRIKDDGTARALDWNAIYRASSFLALPTTTVISETMYLNFKYNSADAKWDFLGYLGGPPKRIPTAADGTSLTANVSNDGVIQSNTAGAGTWTINAPTGTAYPGKTFLFELKATNAQTFSWNAAWTDSVTCAKPTTIGAGKTIWVGFVYSAIKTGWYCTIFAELD